VTKKGSDKLPDDIAEMSYEAARDELVQVVSQLEQGQVTLEESISLWERGEALATRCEQWLDNARERLIAPVSNTMTNSETPEEAAARKAEARRLRRQRQNTRNLVASIAASLGLVVFLVLVVARPDESIVPAIDYQLVAANTEPTAPGPLLAPPLDDTWNANRAELTEEPYGRVWAIGLVSTTGDYVELAQVFGGAEDAVTDLVGVGGVESDTTLAGQSTITWTVIDRSELENPGNALFAVVSETDSGLVVISGTTQRGVLFIASQALQSAPEMWGVSGE